MNPLDAPEAGTTRRQLLRAGTLGAAAAAVLAACGTTDEIIGSQTSASFQIRLAPDELSSAIAALSAHGVAATTASVDQLSVTLADGWRGRDLNRLLAEVGVYADQIVHNTVSLEEAFLAMTQGAHQ